MQCDQFVNLLEQQDDGPLPALALAHADSCENCQTLMADLYEIHDVARELGAEGIAPPEHIWVSLRNQLEAEGLIRDGQPALARNVPSSGAHSWWTAFQRPAFAGAFLALLVVGATAISFRQPPSQTALHSDLALTQDSSMIPSADSAFKEEMLTIGNDALPGYRATDAAVTASIRRNLGMIDNFIAMCEKDVREQPDNEVAREYLYGAYEQKAELLATATSRGVTGGLQ